MPKTKKQTHFDDLPIETQFDIFSQLRLKDFAKARIVSKKWHTITSDKTFYLNFLTKLATDNNIYFEASLLNQINCKVATKHLQTLINKINRQEWSCTAKRIIKKYLLNMPNEYFVRQYLDEFNLENFQKNQESRNDAILIALYTNNKALSWHLLISNNPDGSPLVIANYGLLNLVAELGFFAGIKYLLSLKNSDGVTPRLTSTLETLNCAAKSGNLVLFQHILTLKKPDGSPLVTPYQYNYDVEEKKCYSSLLDRPTKDDCTFSSAIESGNLEIVKYLLTLKDAGGLKSLFTANLTALNDAAKFGHINIFKYFMSLKHNDKITPLLIPSICTLDYAAGSDNFKMLECVLDLKNDDNTPLVTPNLITLCGPARTDNLEMFKHLLTIKNQDQTPLLVPTVGHLVFAVDNQSLNIIEFILNLKKSDGTPLVCPNIEMLNSAARKDNLVILKCLLAAINVAQADSAITPDQSTLRCAYNYNRLDIFKFLLTLTKTDGAPLLNLEQHQLMQRETAMHFDLSDEIIALNEGLLDGTIERNLLLEHHEPRQEQENIPGP